jgi:hypothetical protein
LTGVHVASVCAVHRWLRVGTDGRYGNTHHSGDSGCRDQARSGPS